MNIMKKIRIAKLTLNIGAGNNQDVLKKGMTLLKTLTGVEPVKTTSDKRIPGWGVRPGLPIGCKLTLRGKEATELLKRLLRAKESKLKQSCFDENGNVSFGIHEYIDVPDLNYDTEIGIMGFQACVSLSRPGFRVKYRKKQRTKPGLKHRITKSESLEFFKNEFKITVEEN